MSTKSAAPSLRQRTPLRTQQIVVTVALAALAVVVVAVGSAWVLRSYLYGQVDDQLYRSVRPVMSGELDGPRMPMGRGRDDFTPPVVFFGQVYDAQGNVVSDLGSSGTGSVGQPDLPVLDAATVSTLAGEPFTVSGEPSDWRVLVARVSSQSSSDPVAIAVGVPLESVQSTVARLLVIDAVVALVVLVLLAVVARWMVLVSLRPLAEIEQTAHSIAEGDLSRRVEHVVPDTEVGRLGSSLNAMLERIEAAFTAQQESERSARASEEQMRRLVADASHELRTPLTTIRGYAELYRQGAAPADLSVDEVLERIETTAGRMGVLVDDLLLLARLDQHRALERQPVDILTIAGDVVRDIVPVAADHQVQVVADVSEPAIVLGDAARLRQAVSNLVVNALRHTPAGTEVTVSVRVSGPEVALEVADNGPGMDDEAASRAFERFYRGEVSRARDGDASSTGLGLAIVEAIVEAHKGHVELSSTPGAGTSVRISLPRLAA
jgi:two-component system OmpR family sensor kinase